MKTFWLTLSFIGLVGFVHRLGLTEGEVDLYVINNFFCFVINYFNFWQRLERDTNYFKY